jgi:hypothetical protein
MTPFSYAMLFLYFATNCWIFLKIVLIAKNSQETLATRLAQRDIDLQNKIIYLPFIQGKDQDSKLDPKKQKIAILLMVITQVFLLKMSWHSTLGSILILMSSSLFGMICLIASMGLFFSFLDIAIIEKGIEKTLKPALRL